MESPALYSRSEAGYNFYEFSSGSNDGILAEVFVKFLSKNPIAALDFAVIRWFFRLWDEVRDFQFLKLRKFLPPHTSWYNCSQSYTSELNLLFRTFLGILT